MRPLPAPRTLLRDLGLPPLSPSAQEQLTRARVFLFVVQQPDVQVRALLAGYSRETHVTGAYAASLVSGERQFGEWRQWRSLRPPRDPDLPELVAALDGFVQRWQPRALAAVAELPNPDHRRELETYLGDDRDRPSRTWRAKAWASHVELLGKIPTPFALAVWDALVAQGIEAELAQFRVTLEAVQRFIAEAPLEAEELAEMQAAREDAVPYVVEWLDARRVEFAPHVSDETFALLALGELVPPQLPDVPISVLARFEVAARA